MAALASHGIAAVVLRYRLLPKYGLEEAMDDLEAAVAHVRKTRGGLVGAIGFSAGSHLIASLCRRAGARGQAQPLDAQVLVYPCLDPREWDDGACEDPTLMFFNRGDERYPPRAVADGRRGAQGRRRLRRRARSSSARRATTRRRRRSTSTSTPPRASARANRSTTSAATSAATASASTRAAAAAACARAARVDERRGALAPRQRLRPAHPQATPRARRRRQGRRRRRRLVPVVVACHRRRL